MKSVPLNKLLMLQMAYCFTGIMYNVCSLLAQRNGQQAWASTDAVVGVAVVALYGLFLSTGLMQNLSSYRILMAISVILFGYGGVGVHLVSADQMALYQSAWTWAAAIGILAILGRNYTERRFIKNGTTRERFNRRLQVGAASLILFIGITLFTLTVGEKVPFQPTTARAGMRAVQNLNP